MNHLGDIFSFTFRQHVRGKGYQNATAVVALLCFLLPALVLPLAERLSGKEPDTTEIKTVYVADGDTAHPADYRALHTVGKKIYQEIRYETADSVEEAAGKAAEDPTSLILSVEKGEDYQVFVLTPENSLLSDEDVAGFQDYISENFRYILVQKADLSLRQLVGMVVLAAESFANSAVGEGGADPLAVVRDVLAAVLPYLNIIILYFLALVYGQGTANAAIQEKTSKLMDSFLVTVKPGTLLLGKVLAISLSGILQLFCWIAGLAGGFAAGVFLVKRMNPATDMALIQLFKLFGKLSGMFTPYGILLALLLLAAGLLLYCALAAVGGALAGKPEDLSSTNTLFMLVLVVSFFATLYGGGTASEAQWLATPGWQLWVPFTAILIMPAKILLGTVSVWQACGSLAVVIASAVALTLAAGWLYRLMALYQGNPPDVKRLLGIIRENLHSQSAQ